MSRRRGNGDGVPAGNGDRVTAGNGDGQPAGARLMDLRLLLAAPTEAERAAVDGFVDGATGVAQRPGPRR